VTNHRVEPLSNPPDATVVIPGSKSITNRALPCALLANGNSTLIGILDSDDTVAMLSVIGQLGAQITYHSVDNLPAVTVAGVNNTLRSGPRALFVNMSGTTARFTPPLAARGEGEYHIDGDPQMRNRPMNTTTAALRSLGVAIDADSLPMTVTGGLTGGKTAVPANVSSQFASGLLLAAPGTPGGLDLELTGEVVSQPYLDLTIEVMRAFGADVTQNGSSYSVASTPYRASDYRIEPDASAASYFFAAAALTGGRVRIEGLGPSALQGDVKFVDVLELMGAQVTRYANAIEVQGTGTLRGVDVDMRHISDTAQTLAAIAPFAEGPTRVTGIGFIRNKETDRIAAVVNELQRLGVDAVEEDDGFAITPGPVTPGAVRTYDDHRMAMSFALIGLMSPGIEIEDPGCVSKTFPTYWDVLDGLRS